MSREMTMLTNAFSERILANLQHALRLSACGLAIVFGGLSSCETLLAQDDGKPTRPVRRAVPAPISESISALDTKSEVGTDSEVDKAAKQRAEKFAAYMSGASLKGRFTIMGRGDKMPEETYTISKCEKLPEDNMYRFTARIQYGDTDTELPMDIPVEWAGDTPVISLTNMWLPGLGTFSARVLIYKDTYAGTWIHDDVGGQMFGVIVREGAATDKAEAKPETEPKPTTEGK